MVSGYFTGVNGEIRSRGKKLVMASRRAGKFVEGLGEFSNRYVKNYKDDPEIMWMNVDICVKLKKREPRVQNRKIRAQLPALLAY